MSATVAQAQGLVGYANSTSEPAGGVFTNPANIAGYRYKADINIVTANGLFTSNAIGLNLFRPSDKSFTLLDNSGDKQIYANVDLMLPSFIYALDKNQSFGFTSRFRFLANEGGMSEDLLSIIANKEGINLNREITEPNTAVNLHGFFDLGLSYGAVVFQNKRHMVKAGLTLKLYIGVAAGSFQLSNGLLQLADSATFLKATGRLASLYSTGMDKVYNGDYGKLSSNAFGYGIDFGVVYEWKKEDPERYESKYIVRAGIAVSDLGQLRYATSSNSAIYNVNLPNGLSINELLGQGYTFTSLTDYIGYLKTMRNDAFQTESEPAHFSVALPAYIRTTIDYNFYKNFYVNLNIGINLKNEDSYGAQYSDVYTISPRWEGKEVSVYSPVGYSSSGRVDWGAGVNFGVLFVGSGSLFSSLISKNVASLDVYFGLHVPIGDTWIPKKHKIKPPVVEGPSY